MSTVTTPTARWDVLAATIKAAMRDVNMRQADLVRESGLSVPTIRAFVSGQPRWAELPSAHTMRKLEEGLLWPPDSVSRILAGEDPARVLEVAAVVPINGGRPATSLSDELLGRLDERYVPKALAEESLPQLDRVAENQEEFRERLERLEAAGTTNAGRLSELEAKVEELLRRRRRSDPAAP